MSVAHELVERGLDVVVLESGDIAGGKARSIPVFHEGEDTSGHQVADGAGSSVQHRVPGEHALICSSSDLASFKSSVSKPSVNQP